MNCSAKKTKINTIFSIAFIASLAPIFVGLLVWIQEQGYLEVREGWPAFFVLLLMFLLVAISLASIQALFKYRWHPRCGKCPAQKVKGCHQHGFFYYLGIWVAIETAVIGSIYSAGRVLSQLLSLQALGEAFGLVPWVSLIGGGITGFFVVSVTSLVVWGVIRDHREGV